MGQAANGNRGENRSRLILILLLVWNHPTNATSRVSNIAPPARDEVDMHVEDGLTGLGASIDADIEACDSGICGEDLFALFPEH